MKRHMVIWMALMAVLMTVGFTSCDKEDLPSKDDDVTVDNVVDNGSTDDGGSDDNGSTDDGGSDDNGNDDGGTDDGGSDDNPTTGVTKKLVRFVYVNDYKYQTGTDVTFTYDDQGLLKEAVQINSYGDDTMRLEHKFTWSEKSIAITVETIDETEGNSVENSTLTLEDGLVQNVVSDDFVKDGAQYSYDSSRRLDTAKTYFGNETYTWNDAQLNSMSVVDDDCCDDYIFEYGENSTVSGFCPLIPHRLTNIVLYWAHPEIIGLLTDECPNRETYKSATPWYTLSNTYTYECEYDDEGFITKITETYKADGEVYNGVYTMAWE